jgi:hypothetical protein
MLILAEHVLEWATPFPETAKFGSTPCANEAGLVSYATNPEEPFFLWQLVTLELSANGEQCPS